MDSLASVLTIRRGGPTLLPTLLAAALLGGCGSEDQPSAGDATTTTTGQREAGAAQLYFTAGEQFRTVERKIPVGPPARELHAAAAALIAGPTPREARTEVTTASQIPAGTELRGVTLADGTATVAVSGEFTRGVPARPGARDRAERAEIDARLAQVTYTLTQFPGVERARVVAGGEPVAPGAGGAEQARADLERPERGPRPIDRKAGGRSLSVRALQQRLAELRYLPRRAVDGVNGYRTEQAVLAFQSWRGLERDGIVGPATRAALAKASPPRPHGNGPPRRIEVYPDRGVTLLVNNDRTKRAIHVSTGGPGNETPAGTFKVFRKELRSWSVPFQTWLPFASYFNNGIAFHEYPDVPTYPASHGCVRVPAPEAPGVYAFATIGTTVIVL